LVFNGSKLSVTLQKIDIVEAQNINQNLVAFSSVTFIWIKSQDLGCPSSTSPKAKPQREDRSDDSGSSEIQALRLVGVVLCFMMTCGIKAILASARVGPQGSHGRMDRGSLSNQRKPVYFLYKII